MAERIAMSTKLIVLLIVCALSLGCAATLGYVYLTTPWFVFHEIPFAGVIFWAASLQFVTAGLLLVNELHKMAVFFKLMDETVGPQLDEAHKQAIADLKAHGHIKDDRE